MAYYVIINLNDSQKQLYISGGRHNDQLKVPELVECVPEDGQEEVGEFVTLVNLYFNR